MSQNIDKISSLSNLAKKLDSSSKAVNKDELNFGDILKNSIEDVNQYQKKGDKAMADIATGEVKDLHQAALAIGKAETSKEKTAKEKTVKAKTGKEKVLKRKTIKPKEVRNSSQ